MKDSNKELSFSERFKSSNSTSNLGSKDQENSNTIDFSEKYKAKKNQQMNAVNASPETHRKRADADLLFLVKGIDDNRPAWYYVLIDRLKIHMFNKALNDNIIHLEEFGKILYSAYGEDPPEEIKQKIKEEFGIND